MLIFRALVSSLVVALTEIALSSAFLARNQPQTIKSSSLSFLSSQRPLHCSWISPSTCLFAEAEGGEKTEDEPPQAKKESSSKSSDILNSPAFLKRKLDVLKSDIAKADDDLEAAKQRLEAGKAEWGDQLDELQKEYQNIQSRMNSQSKQGDDMATLQVARQMLEVLDTFDRAFGAVTPESEEQSAIEAEYKASYDMIINTLNELGVEQVETVGKEFDYEVHQAVMQRPSEDYEEGIVCEEFQKGFKLGNQLVRAAMVAVAA